MRKAKLFFKMCISNKIYSDGIWYSQKEVLSLPIEKQNKAVNDDCLNTDFFVSTCNIITIVCFAAAVLSSIITLIIACI